MQLVERGGDEGTVELSGVRRSVSLMLTPEARIGDHLLIHAGYAIGTVDPEEAAETLRLFGEIIAADEARSRGEGAGHGGDARGRGEGAS